MSKLRYGLQLCNKVRLNENDPKNNCMLSLQVAQNEMLRIMNGSSLKDHTTTQSLFNKFNLPSVNQLSAEIKIIEAWKIMNIQDYPIKLWPNEPNRSTNGREVRGTSIRELKEDSSTKIGKTCFVIDTARLWNQSPAEIKMANTLNQAKTAIKNIANHYPLIIAIYNLQIILALWSKQCSPYFMFPFIPQVKKSYTW